MFQGRNFINTVADAIYHFGFDIRDGRYFNEDSNDNELTADVAGWLIYFLNGVNVVHASGLNDELGTGPALLHKSTDRRSSPFPGRIQPTASVTDMSSAVKPFRTATRT